MDIAKILKSAESDFIYIINTALCINLTQYQIDYLLHDINIPPEIERDRGTGTSTVRAIKLCFSVGKPIYGERLVRKDFRKMSSEYPDVFAIAGSDCLDKKRFRMFIAYAIRIRENLAETKYKNDLREIKWR